MINTIKIEINAVSEEWSLFSLVSNISMTVEQAREWVKEEVLPISYLIYTDTNKMIDILVDFEETVCYKVTYETTS